MKYVSPLLLTLFVLFSHHAYSLNAASDLDSRIQSEINTYIEKVNTQRGSPLMQTADLILGSGLTDQKLNNAIEEKFNQLYKLHQNDSRNSSIAKELNTIMRTLAAVNPESGNFISKLLNSSSRGIRERSKRLIPKLQWFKQRNSIMQNPEPYQEGQKIMTYRFLNLLESEDPTMRRWAAEEINRYGGADPIVYETMRKYIDAEKFSIRSDTHLDALAWFCRILRDYDTYNSRDFLLALREDKQTHKKLKKYSKIR